MESRAPRGYRIDVVCDVKHPQPGGGAPRRPLITAAESMGSETRTATIEHSDGHKTEHEVPAHPPWRLTRARGVEATIFLAGSWLDPATARIFDEKEPRYEGAYSPELEARGYRHVEDPLEGTMRHEFRCPAAGCNRQVAARDLFLLFATLTDTAERGLRRLTLTQLSAGLAHANERANAWRRDVDEWNAKRAAIREWEELMARDE